MTNRVGSIVGEIPMVRVSDRMTLDPRNAVAQAIASYLLDATFYRDAGTDPLANAPTAFQLRNVRREWPEPSEALEYPCASIIDYGAPKDEASSLTPEVMGETWGKFGEGTVLVKIAETVGEFQVDFFANDRPTREAIAAQLPGIFSPGQTFGVTLQCSDQYFGLSARVRMLDRSREDASESAFVREWRLRCVVSYQVPTVDLRALPGAKFAVKVQDCDTTAGSAGC